MGKEVRSQQTDNEKVKGHISSECLSIRERWEISLTLTAPKPAKAGAPASLSPSHRMVWPRAWPGEFRRNNFPKPFIVPARRVTYRFDVWSYCWDSEDPLTAGEYLGCSLKLHLCMDIEAKIRLSGWVTRSGFHSQLLWLRHTCS